MKAFGDAVRVAREARGWTQRDLAMRVGVSQRAVSSWERGVSEPNEETRRAVADVLELPAVEVLGGVRRPVISGDVLLGELPFENLTPSDFEDFAVTLARGLYPDAAVSRQGQSGHKQYGFDVVVERDGEVLAGIQCKRVRRFGAKDAKAAVAAATMSVGTAIIFLSRPASPDLRAEVGSHPGWQLWDKNKLSHEVHDLPPDRAVALVDRYFPLLRERFLGLPLGPWLEPAQFFSRGPGRRSAHQWPLVGRQGTLEALAQFALSPGGRVGILVGRGGTGKTKLLHALSERVASEVAVRFLDRDPVIGHRVFSQLPSGALLVIIDDAHDEDSPVGQVVTGVLDANPGANILLALRPEGCLASRHELRRADVDLWHLAEWELDDLKLDDAEALAHLVLGQQHGHAARRLAVAARDCPYLLVAGALLVREGSLELRRLEGDQWLRRELIESLAGTVTADQDQTRQEVLHAVAALQPVRAADPDFRHTLETLTGRAFDQLVPHLSAWEDAGMMLRRGQTYRVVPDLLGDALLARASSARETGVPTDYLDRVRQAAKGAALANLIVNAGRIDWQEPEGRRGRLVASLWREITAAFRSADAAERTAMLEVLASVAFYQPRPSFEIVRWAMQNPSDAATIDAGAGLLYTYTDRDVRLAAAGVLRAAAHDPVTLADAADLLWELGRDDARQPNQHPDHGVRVLAELARFDRRGVTILQQSFPAIVDRWLRRPPRDTDAHDPMITLHPLLATDGHDEIWSPNALTFRPFLVPPDQRAVTELRSAVLDLAFRELTAANPCRAAAAAKTIGTALTGPRDGFGMQVGPEDQAPWDKHFRRTLDRLHDTVRANPPRPVISVALREQLQWSAEHQVSPVHLACREILDILPSGPEHYLARALHGGPADPPADAAASSGYTDWLHAEEQLHQDCIASIATWSDPQALTMIENLLGDLERTLGDGPGRARPFLWSLVTARPSLGEALAVQALDAPSSQIARNLSIIISGLSQARTPRVVDLARAMLDSGDIELARQIAHAFGVQRNRPDLLPGEPALLKALVRHPDPDGIVPGAALGVVRHIAAEHPELAVELLTCLPGGRKDIALSVFAMAFGPHGQLSWENLATRHKQAFLDALCAGGPIGEYEIAEFLAMLSLHDPHSVISLLTGRVEAAEKDEVSPTTALPFAWIAPWRFREREDFPDLLRRIREWLAAQPASPWRHHLGSRVFATVAGTYDAATLQVIEEYLDVPDSARIKTVATMLRGAPRELVWDAGFVRRCLQAADACGADSLSAIQDALYAALLTGGTFAGAGWASQIGPDQQGNATRLADQAPRGSSEEQFYLKLAQSASIWIERSTADIPNDGRKW